jgi:AhpD family alkylhydroperoxidase
MALIAPVQDEDATAEQNVLFDYSRKALGRVADAVRVAAHKPRIMQPLFGFMIGIASSEVSSTLDRRTKTLIALKTSLLNGCKYCVGHNTIVGNELGFDEEHILALEGDYSGSDLFSAAEIAAIDWAHHLTERTHRGRPDLMPNLKRHFDDERIVEITMLCGYWNFWNRFNDGLQIEFEGQAFNKNFGRDMKVLNAEDYVEYMKACWWNDPIAQNVNAAE